MRVSDDEGEYDDDDEENNSRQVTTGNRFACDDICLRYQL